MIASLPKIESIASCQKKAAPAASPGTAAEWIGRDEGAGEGFELGGACGLGRRRRAHLFFNEPPPAKSPAPVHESLCTESVTLLQSGENVVW